MKKNEFQPYIDRLQELADEEDDDRYADGSEAFLQGFRPVALRRISGGEDLLAQIEKLLAHRNADRAVKLLSATRPAVLPRFIKVLFIPVLFSTVAVIVTAFGVKQVQEAEESLSWPSTPGWILKSEVTVSTSTTRSGNSRHGGSSTTTTTTYSPSIRYEYAVKGKAYTSSRIAFSSHSGKEEAQRTVAKYPQGAKVAVYYNPDEPERATLETGIESSFYYIFALAGLFFIAAMIATYPLWWKHFRRSIIRKETDDAV